jgi:alpha/beta hydrolase fold
MTLKFFSGLAVFILLATASSTSVSAQSEAIASRMGQVEGLRLHYLTAGRGPTVILLHGYAETSRMWRPIIPLLAKRFTVIAPDLPGIGDSEIPQGGLDMKTAAIRIHGLAKSLGVDKAKSCRTRYWPDGRVCLRRAISGRNRKACGNGRLPSGGSGMGGCL